MIGGFLTSCLPPPDLSDPDPIIVSGTGTGLMGSYFDTQGSFVGSRVDSEVSFFWAEGSSPMSNVPHDYFSVVWTGQLEAPLSGDYVFTVFGDDGVRVFVDGVNVLPIDAWSLWIQVKSE
jgi:hypothetical protein